MKVLITNGDNLRALAFLRAIAGMPDIELHISAERYFAASFFSRYRHSRTINVNPKADPKLFLRQLADYVKQHSIDILIPINSDEIDLILRNRKLFSCSIPYVGHKLFAKAKDKWQFYSILKKLDIPTPFTTEDPRDIRKYPVIVKPKASAGSKGVHIAADMHELKDRLRMVRRKYGKAIIQEYVEGQSYGVAAVCSKGRVLSTMAYRNLRQYPIRHGTSTARISVHHKRFQKQAERILTHLRWHGVAQFDIIGNRFIEMNPRLYTSLNATVKAGANYPYLLCNMKAGVRDYRDNVLTRIWMVDAYVRLRTRSQKIRAKAAYLDDLDPKDPLPAIPLIVKAIRGKLI